MLTHEIVSEGYIDKDVPVYTDKSEAHDAAQKAGVGYRMVKTKTGKYVVLPPRTQTDEDR